MVLASGLSAALGMVIHAVLLFRYKHIDPSLIHVRRNMVNFVIGVFSNAALAIYHGRVRIFLLLFYRLSHACPCNTYIQFSHFNFLVHDRVRLVSHTCSLLCCCGFPYCLWITSRPSRLSYRIYCVSRRDAGISTYYSVAHRRNGRSLPVCSPGTYCFSSTLIACHHLLLKYFRDTYCYAPVHIKVHTQTLCTTIRFPSEYLSTVEDHC